MTSNGILKNNDIRLLVSCFLFWFYFFGALTVAIEATNRWTAFILFLIPVITFVIIKRLSIAPPNQATVEEVLGKWIECTDEIPERDLTAPAAANSNGSSNNQYFSVWAHRFAGLDAPENTLEALDACIQNGAKAVEFDLILTADLVPVVFHDWRLDRIANYQADIRQTPWAKVQTFDVSQDHPFRSKFPNAKIPLFDDVIKKCVEHKIHMVIDIKDDRPEVVTVLTKALAQYPELKNLALVSAFNPFIVWAIRKANPQLVGGLTWRPYYMSCSKYSPIESNCVAYPTSVPMYYIMRLLDVCHQYVFNHIGLSLVGISVVLLEKDQITREVVQRWKSRNIRVMAWTVNIPLEKLMFMKHYGVPVITDSMLGPSDPMK